LSFDNQLSEYLRENYRDVGFWNPTKIFSHELGKKIVRMDLNECPHPPSKKVLKAIQKAALELNRYPDGTCPNLTPRLAEANDVPEEHICFGAGSTQLLTAIAEIAVGPGDQIISPEIVWRRFQGVYRAVAATVTSVPNKKDGAIDVGGMIKAVGNNSKLLIVLTPNNPTGLMLSKAEIHTICHETPNNVLLFIDEAYHEFALHAGGVSVLEILKSRKGPWVLTRTFSKAYALAGLRLGYAICSSEQIVNALRLTTSTFNISGIAEAAVMAALDDTQYTRFILEENEREMNRIKSKCQELGLSYMDSVTNFISIDVGLPNGNVVKAMRDRGIRISTPGYESNGTFIRASTGLSDDTTAFLTTLEEVLAQLA
jgi:histidinol-phosphate aminotransferase